MQGYSPRYRHYRTKADHSYPAGHGGRNEMKRYWRRVARAEGKRAIKAALQEIAC
jgi:hypothetical protein